MQVSANKFWADIHEEIFFFQYHMKLPMSGSMCLPIRTRKWMIQRFTEQKEKENQAMEAARKKK